jgi:hypothetical protein
MIRQSAALCLLLLFAIAAARPAAHDEFRVIGTLAKHQDSKIEVKKKSGQTVSIRLDKQTAISQDGKKVAATALRVGQSLVVDAYGDTENDSLALEIRIVPPIRK